MKPKTVVFTGGHHVSALEVAKRLRSEGWQVVWFGHRHSMWSDPADSAEYREVTAAGISFYDLQAGKFYRTLHPLKVIRIPWGFLQAFFWLLRLRLNSDPKGIVSFGGYLAVPVVICGWLLGIPSLTHEQTLAIGWANKLISLFAKTIALTWPDSLAYYPQSKTVVTGLPLRPQIAALKKESPAVEKPSSIKTVYITGGKQGAHTINLAVFSALPRLLKKYRLIHQTGSSGLYDDYRTAKSHAGPRYQAFDYDSARAIAALAAADVVVSRAGAHIVYELGYLGKPSLLIPIPWSSHQEQLKNAQLLQKNNLAVILPESQLTAGSLLAGIARASRLTGRPLELPASAADRLLQLIKQTFSA